MELMIDLMVTSLIGFSSLEEEKSLKVEWMKRLLKALVASVQMTPICEAMVVADADNIHGIQVIAESHIAVEVRRRSHRELEVHATVFSCKKFDTGSVMSTLGTFMNVETGKAQIISRVLLS